MDDEAQDELESMETSSWEVISAGVDTIPD